MATIPTLPEITAVTGDDLLVSHDITTNRSGRVSAASLKSYTNSGIDAGDITYSFTNVENQLDKSTRIIPNFAALSSTGGFIGDKVYLLGHTVAGIGGGYFIAKAATGLTADGGTVAIFGALAWVRESGINITPQMFGAIGDGVTDDTSAINNAIASFPLQGTPNWKPWTLTIPQATYKVTAPINIKNQQGSTVSAYGAIFEANFNGVVLQIGDLSGVNDVLWVTIEGLKVLQYNTGLSASAVVAQHLYSCTLRDCYFYGGRYSLIFDGNGNLVQRCIFRASFTANVLAAGTANNEVNLFQSCAFELGQGYGLDLQVNAGVGGGTEIRNCYFEANATSNVRSKNSNMFLISGCYFNLQNGAPGITLDGTVGAAFPDGFGKVSDNRILGHASLTPGFIVESNTSSINCTYSNNKVEEGGCNLYGLAPRSINLDRRRDFSYVLNGDMFTGSPPTGWTVVGSQVSVSTSASPYGAGAGVVIPTATYIHQTISAPTNALLRFSVWGEAVSGGTCSLQIWTVGLGAKLKEVNSSSTNQSRLELYLSSTERSSSASVVLVLRNTGTSNVKFSDIKIEDMTN